MEENVALDTTKQKKFVKSIKGIKKLIKKNENEKPEETSIPKERKGKKKRPDRGLVYLSHIPHGFYEHEMTQYFKQFGLVTNVRVIRSKKTGNSKGCAFVEFREPAVAEIVAETMNNYLMGKRLIKAVCVPPEKQRPKAMRKHWTPLKNPGRDAKLKHLKAHNEDKDDQGDLKRARKLLSNLNKTKKRLSELGINYDFFTPVDVPEALKKSLNPDKNDKVDTVKVEKKLKKDKKLQNSENKDTNKDKITKTEKVKLEKNKKNKKVEVIKESSVKVEENKSVIKKEKKQKKEEAVVNKKEQKNKQKKLKESGVSSMENFIKVQEDSDDSDVSFEFDSDEYEKMLEDDGSDIETGDDGESNEEDGDESGDVEGESDEEEIIPPTKKNKTKSRAILAQPPRQTRKQSNEANKEEIIPPLKKSKGKPLPIVALPQKQTRKQKTKAPEQIKRKIAEIPSLAPKKPKFEKQAQQPMKKHFKKKK